MATNILGIPAANNFLPYTQATKRTKWISVTDAGHIVLSGSNISNSAINRAAIMAYADSLGNWHLRFNMRLTCTSGGARTSATVTFASTYAVVFKNTANFYQDVGVSCTSIISMLASADPNAATISISHESANESSYKLSGDVELNAEPAWAAANMENQPTVDVYIPSAAAGIQGLVDNTSGNTVGTPIKGRTDGNAPASGYVGEVLQAIQSTPVAASASGQYWDITSKALTPGTWSIDWHVEIFNNGSTAFTEGLMGVGTASGNNAQDMVFAVNKHDIYKTASAQPLYSSGTIKCVVSATQITLLTSSSSTGTARTGNTLYLKGYANDITGGPPTGYGYLIATRIA